MVTCPSAFKSIVQQHDTLQRLHVAKIPMHPCFQLKKFDRMERARSKIKASSRSWSKKTKMMS